MSVWSRPHSCVSLPASRRGPDIRWLFLAVDATALQSSELCSSSSAPRCFPAGPGPLGNGQVSLPCGNERWHLGSREPQHLDHLRSCFHPHRGSPNTSQWPNGPLWRQTAREVGLPGHFPGQCECVLWGTHSTSHITPVMCGGLPRGPLDTSHSVGTDTEDEWGASFLSPEVLGSHCSFIFIVGLNISLKKKKKLKKPQKTLFLIISLCFTGSQFLFYHVFQHQR